MLHNFLRSLGRPSRLTKRASRRKFSPDTQRSDAAIERLEERMLLSGTTLVVRTEWPRFEWHSDPTSSDPNAVRSEFRLESEGQTVSAELFWSAADSEGNPGLANNSTIVFDGVALTGTPASWTLAADGSVARVLKYRADVTSLIVDDPAHTYVVSGLAGTAEYSWLSPSLSLARQFHGQNTAPVASDIRIVARNFGSPSNLLGKSKASDADGDSLRFEIVSPPDIGTLTLGSIDQAGNQVFYHMAPKDFFGDVTFSYRVFDGYEYSNVSTVTISIIPDLLPTLTDQTIKGTQDQPVVGKLQWDDPEGDPMVVDLLQAPKVGTLVVDQKTWDFVYTPPQGFTGTVSFTYGLWGYGAENKVAPATVTIVIKAATKKPRVVKPVQQPPVAQPQSRAVLPSNAKAKASIAPTNVGPSHANVNGKNKLPPHSEHIQTATIFVPIKSDGVDDQPVKVTSVIFASDELDISRSLAHSLRLTRTDENGLDATDVEQPVSYELRDVNGDGREDLIAVFELDWAELWDGREFGVLTGRLV